MADDGTAWFGKPAKTIHPGDAAAAEKAHGILLAACEKAGAVRLGEAVRDGGALSEFLVAVMVLSPFLGHQIERQTDVLQSLFDVPLTEALEAILRRTETMRHGEGIASSEAETMTALRREKAVLHLLLALGDIAGALHVRETTTWL